MPDYSIHAHSYEISRNAMLLDTNVIVSAFDTSDGHHEEASYFLNEFDHQWIVPIPVVVEAWGFLVGRQKNWSAGFQMLQWLSTPGKAMVISEVSSGLTANSNLVHTLRIDCVDAMLLRLANELTVQCGLTPPIRVATYDTRDFFRTSALPGLRYGIFDMNALDEIDFQSD